MLISRSATQELQGQLARVQEQLRQATEELRATKDEEQNAKLSLSALTEDIVEKTALLSSIEEHIKQTEVAHTKVNEETRDVARANGRTKTQGQNLRTHCLSLLSGISRNELRYKEISKEVSRLNEVLKRAQQAVKEQQDSTEEVQESSGERQAEGHARVRI